MISDSIASRFKEQDSSSYDEVSETFERLTEKFSRPMADRIIHIAGLQPTDRILDVGTGTGILARTAAPGINAGSITGIDLSQGMLATARRKASGEGHDIEFLHMDAESLEFQDNTFDTVASLFALCHFPNPAQALIEIHRVLKPGGRIVIGVGSAPRLMSVDGIKAGLYRTSELFRRLLNKGDYQACQFLECLMSTYLPKLEVENPGWTENHTDYSSHVPEYISRAGFSNINSYWTGQRSIIGTPEEFWELQVTFSSVARTRIGLSKPEHVTDLKNSFLEKCTEHLQRGGRLVYATGASIYYAEKIR